METNMIAEKFSAMGARVRFSDLAAWRRFRFSREQTENLIVDVLRDKKGEYFSIGSQGQVELIVPDVRPADRHLLLMARVLAGGERDERIIKILCGHDEREWFAAQVPNGSVSNVDTAKQALKPRQAIASQRKRKVKTKNRHRRKNKGFMRQGEWFFIPVDNVSPDVKLITYREPIVLAGTRAGNKPHVAEEAYQVGGERVYVHPRFAPAGLTEGQRARLFERNEKAAKAKDWRAMIREPFLYVRGAVRHPDHKTIRLNGWHRVVLNREQRSQAVAFLD